MYSCAVTCWKPMAGPPDADLDLHTGVDAAARHELTGHGLLVRVDLGIGPDELVQAAVLGFGVPVGLHDHSVGTHARERSAPRRRSLPVVAAPPPVVAAPAPVVAAPPPVVADDESLSSPHAARNRKPASGTASQAALVVLRMCPPCRCCSGA